jgi:hypothetical protein
LLKQCDFRDYDQSLDHNLSELAKLCLQGPEAANDVRAICEAFFSDGNSGVRWYAYDQLVRSLFETRPYECLDTFFGSGGPSRLEQVLMLRPLRGGGFDALPQEVVLNWAQRDPAARFPIVAMGVRPLKGREDAAPPEWSDRALSVLAAAPDRLAVLEAFATQFVPTSWSGSRAVIIENHRVLLSQFLRSTDPRESAWAQAEDSRLAMLAEQERKNERQRSQTFE